MSELKRTELYPLHLDLAAKMVAFAGYALPVQYSSGIIKEHLHCREYAGFFDISHMGQFLISGDSVAEQLETLTPANIKSLKQGHLRYAILTNAQGGIIDDIIISHTEDGFSLVVNAACKEKDLNYLNTRLSADSKITPLIDQALVAVQGPAAAKVMAQLSSPAAEISFMQNCRTEIDEMPCFISRCGYTGEDGFEISIANRFVKALANILLDFDVLKPAGLGARDTLRLEAALGLYGHEFNETTNPIEAGLGWTFRKQATGFTGSDIILAQQTSGAAKRPVGLLIDGKISIRNNTSLYDDQDNQIGIVTSGGYSPSLKRPIALALIAVHYTQPILYAKVRDRIISANMTTLPFVPHRYHRG